MSSLDKNISFTAFAAGHNLLVVDDEENILKSFIRLFADTPFSILTAKNGQEALTIIKDNTIAAIVSDNMMPGMSGVEFLSRVKDISPDTTRIMLTGYANLETAMAAINRGEVFRFLVKPWDDEELLSTVYEAINRFQLLNSLKKDESTLLSLAQTIELKDPYTRGHCDNVAIHALAIARALNLPDSMLDLIKYGSWLHDCGKIGVPETILNKEGRLSEEEFAIIKKHPRWGADVASQARLDQTIINIILYHHEKFGGGGYPTGISGDDIPLEARIVAVADVFDAVTTDRSYRKAHSFEKGGQIIMSLKDKHLDAQLVDIFLNKLRCGTIKQGD